MKFDTWKTNVLTAFIGFLIFFLLSFQVNLLTTSLIRAGFAGLTFFIITFLFRYMLKKIQAETEEKNKPEMDIDNSEEKESREPEEIQNNSALSEEDIETASRLIKEKLNE
ncbi:hypothetical protein ACE1TI_02365 [Alteribacillus sp. JSM 102045]|uniref:hypothetical protein n=1 Tax=Alteribacillus sp. JSM 102045 TaxID=1562101 RepID=UPI0035C0C464